VSDLFSALVFKKLKDAKKEKVTDLFKDIQLSLYHLKDDITETLPIWRGQSRFYDSLSSSV